MIGRPDRMTELPDFDQHLPGPHGSDVLSDMMSRFRVTGAALLRGEYTAPWAWEAPGARAVAEHLHARGTRVVIFHIVAHGRCWLELDGHPRIELAAGDLVGFPHGHEHRMGWGDGARSFPIMELFPAAPWERVPTIRRVESGELCRILCVYLRCGALLFDPLTAALPGLILVRGSGEPGSFLQATTRMLVEEATEMRLGGSSFIARLTELLFIQIVREHLCRLGEAERGWLAALRDRFVAKALHAFHAAPAHRWTLSEISAQAGLSPSALVERFARTLGMSPMRYLTLWRLQVAAQLLSADSRDVADVANEVGYSAPEAFSRAFKRAAGISPAGWRQQATAHRGVSGEPDQVLRPRHGRANAPA
jgi:AraC-like DNA-binding protein